MVLRLHRAADSVFADSATDDDLSHLVEGVVEGDADSHAYGSVLDGVFAGHIHTGNGQIYHVDRASKYILHKERNPNSRTHSIVYADNDIDYTPFNEHRRKRAFDGPHRYESCGKRKISDRHPSAISFQAYQNLSLVKWKW